MTNKISNVMTIQMAAQLYKHTCLTETAIRRLVRSGEIPCRKVGTKHLITDKAIENWLNGANSNKPSQDVRQ